MSDDSTYEVKVAPAANDKMAEHFEFLARVSLSAAQRLLDGLMRDIKSLEKLPLRNPTFDRPYVPALKYRYLMSGKRYRIVYQVVETTVSVDDIQDCRQNDDKDLLAQNN